MNVSQAALIIYKLGVSFIRMKVLLAHLNASSKTCSLLLINNQIITFSFKDWNLLP